MTTRRAALGGMAAALGALAAPFPALAKSRRIAPRLRQGDTVALVAPASAASEREIANSEFTLCGMGLIPKTGANVAARSGYLAGTDAQRAADINAAFADETVKAIFAVRGGWGGARLLPLLDWEMIRRNPKLFVGYSDNTALHLAIAEKAGFPTLHSPNAASPWPRSSWESLWHLAFAGAVPVLGGAGEEPELAQGPQGRTIREGTARGRLLGGNLTVLSTLMGTPWVPDFDGAILFLEDVNEAEYRIDRMLQQLQLAGVLGRLSGVVFGRCRSCASDEPDYAGFTLDEVLDQHLTPLGIPAFVGSNIGHHRGQLALPHGAKVEIDAGARTIRLLEPIVA
ncbi:S66 peptidase family protein [Qipengyuania gaetbuli]|uniref:S66 peptidase family protein n=1 Tax=Qipengyuania gaetbuli TaxID=266952 RepID=UPI001CD67A96|nr:LD-carboxypeptidase [Qipengyuania gaetbuli]MCA0909766.1 LD-carboxypeptidase [Qipengyuania gaetbuli]